MYAGEMRALPLLLACAVTLVAPAAFANGEAINGFPNWQERVMHEWTNRARCDPQVEMTACGNACSEKACYTPIAPVVWNEKLNHAARFHSDNQKAMNFFAHPSQCTLVSNISAIYPGTCQGAASCACVGGVASCNPTCTDTFARISLFGTSGSGEIIASGTDPNGAFYQWLFESYNKTTCAFDFGPPTNGHRWNLLKAGPAYGFGAGTGPSVGDSGGTGTPTKIVSGSHYPKQSASVEAWMSWYDTAAPKSALINVDGMCSPMALKRGSGTNGAFSATLTNVGSGCHRYFFTAVDSTNAIITYPTTGSLGIGTTGCADWDSTRPATGAGCNCTAQCGGKTCGDDGCGGSCGNCASGSTCQGTQCVAAPSDGGTTADAGPKPDGGGVTTDGGSSGSDSSVPNGDAGDPGSGGAEGDGCSCRTAGDGTKGGAPFLLLGFGITIAALRRRRAA
ncbi:hypothetical protein BH09MYX1_BH09MYX1_42300 [soil metagenome]